MWKLQTYFVFVLLASLVCNGFSTPLQQLDASTSLAIHSRQRRNIHSITKTLIDEVILNLQQSAATASASVANFTTALGGEARVFNEQLNQNINKLKEAIQQAVDEARARAVNITSAVYECIENERESAEHLLNSTVTEVTDCVQQRLDEFAGQLGDLANLSNEATAAADEALLKAQTCLREGNIFTVGACLTGVFMETNIASITIGGQIGIVITRISLSVQSLPLTLNVCASARLTKSAIQVTGLLLNVGQCAVKTIISG